MKKYLIGALIGAALTFGSQAYAAVGDTVEAVFAQFNLIINGQPKTLETVPLVYNGTSYLPVRELSNLVGYDVTYKADSRTIELVTNAVYAPIVETSVPAASSSDTIEVNESGDDRVIDVSKISDKLKSVDVVGQDGVTKVHVVYDFNYLPNASSPAAMVGDVRYLPARGGADKYGIHPASVHSDRDAGTITIDGHSSAIHIQFVDSPNAEAFLIQGGVYIREDLFTAK